MPQALIELERGEPLLPPNSTHLAKFYCQRGHIWWRSGDTSRARSELNRAKEISRLQHYGEHSEIMQAIVTLQNVLQNAP